MAVFGAPDVGFVLLGGRSIVGDLTEIQDSFTAVLEETTPLGASDDTWANVGIRKYEGTLIGIYSDSGILTAFESTAVQPLMYALEGNTIGNEFVGIDAIRTVITRQATRDALHRLEASFMASTRMDKGVVLATHAARATASTTTGVDNAAATTAGGVAYMGASVLALGSYTNVVITVEDSANNSSFATIGTFTAITSVPASQRLEISGTIRRYTRTLATFNGSGSSESVTSAVGLARN
jgi:hypothetical protein